MGMGGGIGGGIYECRRGIGGGIYECRKPGCSKPTWNGQPGEYCSKGCKSEDQSNQFPSYGGPTSYTGASSYMGPTSYTGASYAGASSYAGQQPAYGDPHVSPSHHNPTHPSTVY